MTITKRTFLRGLFAAPAIVAAASLMQIRGVSLIRPEELSTAEIVALLERRIEAANLRMQIEMSQKLYGDVHGSGAGWSKASNERLSLYYGYEPLALPFALIPT